MDWRSPVPIDRRCRGAGSVTQPQTCDDRAVTARIGLFEIIQQAPPLPDHDEEAAPRMEILLMGAEMFGQVADPLGQNGDLHFRRTGIAFLAGVFLNDLLLAGQRNRHRVLLYSKFMTRTGRSPPATISARATSLPPSVAQI